MCPRNGARVLLDTKRMEGKTRSLLDRFQLQAGVRQKSDQLTVGQQMVEIADEIAILRDGRQQALNNIKKGAAGQCPATPFLILV